MKRWITFLLLVGTATIAEAESRARDVLLSDSGVLYTVESAPLANLPTSEQAHSGNALVLRTTTESGTCESLVPASLASGIHVEPSLAFDEEDNRLYVFWQRIPSPGTSELIVASFKDGEWTAGLEFGGGDIWVFRQNLNIAITRSVATEGESDQAAPEHVMIAHAIWWEQRGSLELARYAMLELDGGVATSVQIRDLTDLFPPVEITPFVLPEDYDRNNLRQPFIFANTSADAVQVVFANWTTNRYGIGTIRPVRSDAHGVIRIPIGFSGRETGPLPLRSQAEHNLVSAIWPEGGRLVVYATDNDGIRYTTLLENEWTPTRTIRFLEGAITEDLAREALRRYAAQY